MSDHNHDTVRRAAFVVVLACSACSAPSRSDLAQYQRMQGEGAAARSQETISCSSRDLACARLVQMRGEACALTANDPSLPKPERDRLRQCALDDAGTLPRLLPPDAPEEDHARAALLVFDAWRAARDGKDPAAGPASLAEAVRTLNAMPGGEPFARTLAADNTDFDVLTRRIPKADACAALLTAKSQLPSAPAGELADRVDSVRSANSVALLNQGCPK